MLLLLSKLNDKGTTLHQWPDQFGLQNEEDTSSYRLWWVWPPPHSFDAVCGSWDGDLGSDRTQIVQFHIDYWHHGSLSRCQLCSVHPNPLHRILNHRVVAGQLGQSLKILPQGLGRQATGGQLLQQHHPRCLLLQCGRREWHRFFVEVLKHIEKGNSLPSGKHICKHILQYLTQDFLLYSLGSIRKHT